MLNDFIDQFWPSTVDGISLGAIYALVALGYTLVYGVLRLINFAHSEIFMIGTFTAIGAVEIMGITTPVGTVTLIGVVLVLALCAGLVSGGAAILLELVAYRPLRKKGASRLAALISAIGASLFLQQLFALVVIPRLFDRPKEGGRLPVQSNDFVNPVNLFTVRFEVDVVRLVALLGLAAFVAGLVWLYLDFRGARRSSARAEDEEYLAGIMAGSASRDDTPPGGGTATLTKEPETGRAPAPTAKPTFRTALTRRTSGRLLLGGAAVGVVAYVLSLFVSIGNLFTFGTIDVRSDKLIMVIGAILMMVLLDVFVNRTRLGRGIRSTAQDPETAVLMGVNIDRVVMATFALGGAMAGVAAALYIMRFEEAHYMVGFLLGIKAFTAAVLGGIGNLRGALVGGMTLGLLEMYGSSVFGSDWRDVVAFVVLVLVLMFRPTGILGESLQKARA
ncbi:branched-chain amino acid ABC transporter permease [Actinomadura sp. SCN-SB]|uniref:branched-chain amino acid ABC transporter permease n=1 Tax=Actinomadura sp. SCN-SB TaxID=3373092 RepID=UPI00375253D7